MSLMAKLKMRIRKPASAATHDCNAALSKSNDGLETSCCIMQNHSLPDAIVLLRVRTAAL